VVEAGVVVGPSFSIYGDEGVGIVLIPGIYGALRNFKSIHGLYSCGYKRVGTLAHVLAREDKKLNGPYF
jgi:hypothetical protein